MEIKDILREEREKRNLKQDEVANYLNIGRVAYTLYETGKNTPTTESICKLADLYNVSTDYLLGRTNTYHATLKIRKRRTRKKIEKAEAEAYPGTQQPPATGKQ